MVIRKALFAALILCGCDDASEAPIVLTDASMGQLDGALDANRPVVDGEVATLDGGSDPHDGAVPSDGALVTPDSGAQPDAAPSPDGGDPDAGAPQLEVGRVGIGGLYVPGSVSRAMDRAELVAFELAPVRQLNGAIDVDALLERVDCLVMPGGADIDPALFGEPTHPTVNRITAARSEFDFALIHGALERRMPILGICLGAQELNVALGGGLVQDIPSEVDDFLDHRADHEIEILPGTLMAEMYADRRLTVVSRHHQAAESGAGLGVGLRVAAHSEDGVVEAIEATDRAEYPFVFGTQYHAELQLHEDHHDGMWRRFAAACRTYRAANPGRLLGAPPGATDFGACESDRGSGVCVAIEECAAAEGQSAAGFCPGPANIQCCSALSCVVSGTVGSCIATNLCEQQGGAAVEGACPGGEAVSCCLQNAACQIDDGRAGTCIQTELCDQAGGLRERWHCPGPANIQCCVSEG